MPTYCTQDPLDLKTLRAVRDAVAKSRGLTTRVLAEARPGPLNLHKLIPGIYGYDRCAIGEAVRAKLPQPFFSVACAEHGLNEYTAAIITTINDQFGGSNEARRDHMLWWLDREIRYAEGHAAVASCKAAVAPGAAA